MNRLFWLASYPKSGNTWMRLFIANLQSGLDRPVQINELATDGIASDRLMIDQWLPVESTDLTHDELDSALPFVYEQTSAAAKHPLYIKVHDAQRRLPDGRWMFPASATAGVLYIVRDPRDVAPSLANHLSTSIDKAIDMMADPKACLAGAETKTVSQTRQVLSTWSDHVRDWTEWGETPVHAVRYEDMKSDPLATFSEVARFLKIDATGDDISRAIRFCEFKTLQDQESGEGFKEWRRNPNARFFRRGVVGSHKDELTAEQIARIESDHGPMMREWGYLT